MKQARTGRQRTGRGAAGTPRSRRIRSSLAVGTVLCAIVLAGCTGSSNQSALKTRASSKGTTSRAPATTTTTTTTTSPPPTTTSSVQNATSALRYGPGPQSPYTVQPQAAPGSCHYTFVFNDPLPDPHCTPGALNPQVTQDNIGATICRSGYSSSIRPPESVTAPEKRGSAAAYGYTGAFSTGEYDHLVSLELGGDPDDPANLWVEPNDKPNATTTNSKDALENRLHSLVCAGQLSLATAQDAIASNWVTAYGQYVSVPPSPSPPATTSSPPPPAAPAPAPSGCHPTTASGNCYRAGELCPDADHGLSGVAASGESITCEYNNGWRWEPS